jgi:hypothetical protein
MKTNRLIIYRKDIMRITGHSDRYARNLLHRMRKQLNKSRHHLITVDEFCAYMGLNPDEVKPLLD